MSDIQIKTDLIEQLIEISKEAGKAILGVYNTKFDYQIKKDLSPLTKADILSHNIIVNRLERLTPKLPILSEEGADIPLSIRSDWKEYWLIDPLDGTKEFLKKNGEFTVNIALIKNHKPIFGIIHIPVKGETYWGSINLGSFFLNNEQRVKKINVSKNLRKPPTFLVSRSHRSENINLILDNFSGSKIVHKGSSVKFCLIASGEAEIYLRLGATSEWDTAAGEAIVRFAGGHIITTSKLPLTYNLKKNFLNPSFIVSHDKIMADKLISLIK